MTHTKPVRLEWTGKQEMGVIGKIWSKANGVQKAKHLPKQMKQTAGEPRDGKGKEREPFV